MTPGGNEGAVRPGGDSCPCDATDCPRHGDCAECIAFHRKLGDPTACEKIEAAGSAALKQGPGGPVGDDFRLTDYASCAG